MIYAIVFAIPILIIWALVKFFIRTEMRNKPNTDAITLAKKRYAKGKITKAEFEEIKEAIRNTS